MSDVKGRCYDEILKRDRGGASKKVADRQLARTFLFFCFFLWGNCNRAAVVKVVAACVSQVKHFWELWSSESLLCSFVLWSRKPPLISPWGDGRKTQEEERWVGRCKRLWQGEGRLGGPHTHGLGELNERPQRCHPAKRNRYDETTAAPRRAFQWEKR